MSNIFPPSAGGGSGSGLTPEQLASLVADGDLDASQVAQTAALAAEVLAARDNVKAHIDGSQAAQTTAINDVVTSKSNAIEAKATAILNSQWPAHSTRVGYWTTPPTGWSFADGGIVQGFDRRDTLMQGELTTRRQAVDFNALYATHFPGSDGSDMQYWRQVQGGFVLQASASLVFVYPHGRAPNAQQDDTIQVDSTLLTDLTTVVGVCIEDYSAPMTTFWVLWRNSISDLKLSACQHDGSVASVVRTLALTVDESASVGPLDWDLWQLDGRLAMLRSGIAIREDSTSTATLLGVAATGAGYLVAAPWFRLEYTFVLAAQTGAGGTKVLFQSWGGESEVDATVATLTWDGDLWTLASPVPTGYALQRYFDEAHSEYIHPAGCASWVDGLGFLLADIDGLHTITASGAYKQVAGAHPRLGDSYGYPVGIALAPDWLNEHSLVAYSVSPGVHPTEGVWCWDTLTRIHLGALMSRCQRTIVKNV